MDCCTKKWLQVVLAAIVFVRFLLLERVEFLIVCYSSGCPRHPAWGQAVGQQGMGEERLELVAQTAAECSLLTKAQLDEAAKLATKLSAQGRGLEHE